MLYRIRQYRLLLLLLLLLFFFFLFFIFFLKLKKMKLKITFSITIFLINISSILTIGIPLSISHMNFLHVATHLNSSHNNTNYNPLIILTSEFSPWHFPFKLLHDIIHLHVSHDISTMHVWILQYIPQGSEWLFAKYQYSQTLCRYKYAITCIFCMSDHTFLYIQNVCTLGVSMLPLYKIFSFLLHLKSNILLE